MYLSAIWAVPTIPPGEYMVTSVGDVGAKYNTDYSSKGYEVRKPIRSARVC